MTVAPGLVGDQLPDSSPIKKIAIDFLKKLFPLESMSNLIVEPFTRLNFVKSVTTTVGATIEKNYAVEPVSIVIVLFWTCLFLLLSFYILKKRDL